MPVSRRALLSVFTYLLAAAAHPSPPPAGVTLSGRARRDIVGGIVGGVTDLLDLNTTCNAIAKKVSSASEVFYPGTLNYIADNNHWATSSSDTSSCSVEPGNAEDILAIVSRCYICTKGMSGLVKPSLSCSSRSWGKRARLLPYVFFDLILSVQR